MFSGKKIILQHHEQGHQDRDIQQEIKRKKGIEKELDCEFIRINLDKENFNGFVEISRIQNHIIESTEELTKKTVIDDISNKFLRLECKSDNDIKTKCLKYIFKKIFPTL